MLANRIATRWLSISAHTLKGHSKWQNIKAVKGKNDLLKSQTTNVLLRKVKRAAVKGGFDLKLNRELAAIQQEFRSNGLPLDTFNNFLIKLKEKPEQTFLFDVIGPSGSFFILETESDNRNRVLNTIGKYLNKVGGFRIANDSGIRSNFEEKGLIVVLPEKEGAKMEEVGIELDCEEVSLVDTEDGPRYEVICELRKLTGIESQLSKLGFKVESAELEWRARHTITLSPDDSAKVEKFYELLQEDEAIKQIFDNVEPEKL